MTLATRPTPLVDNWNKPFWAACAEGKLVLQRCKATGKCFFPPAPVSPFTGRPDWEWITASGRGTLWSFVVFHQSYFPGMRDELPYPVVMVKLEEGPYLLTNIEGLEPEALKIGMRMAVRFPGGPEGFVLPQFGPEA
ncbi:Zn-ribbon domain-containing OB-fold protein [Siccirubricoccus phaeus]|uniref:Zn-ribbon domain-containing OB-fold protein n=1 Tax=Siccirubricoccus phaeus TaxID=2595053 RepID=UPI00165A5983|nr:OB-fold domain-containing protein [Siccirubricoccus phaeus]